MQWQFFGNRSRWPGKRHDARSSVEVACRKCSSVANLLYGVPFKNNLRKRVCFKTNSDGGLLFTCNPSFLLTASLYRYWQQRDAGGIAISISDTLVSPLVAAEQKLSHCAHAAIQTGETCWLSMSPLGLAGHANVGSPAIGACGTRRGGTLHVGLQCFSLKKMGRLAVGGCSVQMGKLRVCSSEKLACER